MLKLMYITNQPAVALIAESAGVDRIFVDMEYIGKTDRQGGMDTVQSHHTTDDIRSLANVLTKAEILVRINSIGESKKAGYDYAGEINDAIDAGADILMLPYFKSVDEVSEFLALVNGRVKTMLLVETPEAVAVIDAIIALNGIDMIHIGINDLCLGYGKKFMFQMVTEGPVEELCQKFHEKQIPYGFGGIAALGKGTVPAELVIREHYRLGSSCAILARAFCDCQKIQDINKINAIFQSGLSDIRALEKECEQANAEYFEENKSTLNTAVRRVVCEEKV